MNPWLLLNPSSSPDKTASMLPFFPPPILSINPFTHFHSSTKNNMDIWSWISELPDSDEWDLVDSNQLTFQLASSSAQSIHLRAERTLGLNSEASINFSVSFVGFPSVEDKTIWSSDTCPLSSDKAFLPLVLQLLQEIVSRSPTAHDSPTCPRSHLQKLKPGPVSWILDSHSPESFSNFFSLVFLTRLFWVCACDAPSDVGSFYFHSLLAPNIGTFSCDHAPVLRNFFVAVGTDVEVSFMRTFGYMLAKWLILRDVDVGLKCLTPLPSKTLGFSYATESHGLWILKGYAPVKSMQCVQCHGQNSQFPAVIEAKESLLKYALAHQQLEAVIQLEYTVQFHENYIQVNARVDNLRFHVVQLGFKSNTGEKLLEEKHFPSRVRVWVGPEVGASYVGGLSLGRSTVNAEKEMEMHKTLMKANSGNSKLPNYKVKAETRMGTRTKMKNWRWDQDVEGNAAVFDASLCDNTTGVEIATWRPPIGGEMGMNFRSRYTGGGRAFTKSGGLVFAGEECGEGVRWRVNKEMEGSVLKWRIGGEVWLSYCANDVTTSFYETRCVEWCDEVDLPLIPTQTT